MSGIKFKGFLIISDSSLGHAFFFTIFPHDDIFCRQLFEKSFCVLLFLLQLFVLFTKEVDDV